MAVAIPCRIVQLCAWGGDLMDQPIISEQDISDPKLLRLLLQKQADHTRELLERNDRLERIVANTQEGLSSVSTLARTGGLTAEERRLLQALMTGSTDNPASAQNALAPAVDVLPPVQSAIEGQLVYLTTTNTLYRFRATPTPGTWIAI